MLEEANPERHGNKLYEVMHCRLYRGESCHRHLRRAAGRIRQEPHAAALVGIPKRMSATMQAQADCPSSNLFMRFTKLAGSFKLAPSANMA